MKGPKPRAAGVPWPLGRGSGRARRTLGRLAVAAALGQAALAFAASPPDLPLPEFDPASIKDAQRANAALEAVSKARASLEREWRERQVQCYRKILINPCLADIAAERRVAEQRLKDIEVAAHEAQRTEEARKRSEAEAERLQQRADQEAQAQAQQQSSREAREARERDASQRQQERAADEPTRAQRAEQERQRRVQREADLERRRLEAEARAREAPANAAAQARRLKRHEEQQQERERRLQERQGAGSKQAQEPAPAK